VLEVERADGGVSLALGWMYLGCSCGADWSAGFEATEESDAACTNPLVGTFHLEPEEGFAL